MVVDKRTQGNRESRKKGGIHRVLGIAIEVRRSFSYTHRSFAP